jgi:thiosulfate/3-mercaptopyruvate sulfurtransferase
MTHPLVTPAWLASHSSDPLVIVADVRWYLKGKDGRQEYAKGHLPNAIFVDADRDLASPPGTGRPGRHPLPSAAQFAEFLARIGAGPRHLVVAYDDQGGAIAARLWWLLRYFRHDGGRVLDGGIEAWAREGLPLETTTSRPEPAPPMQLVPRMDMVVDKAQVAELVQRGGALLLDARARERFEGIVEPIDPRAGHIPGAKNAPTIENLVAPGGAYLPPSGLRERYLALGALDAERVVAYCGSGLTACHDLLALSLIGQEGALLYEGSWSDWSSDPLLPAAVGKG